MRREAAERSDGGEKRNAEARAADKRAEKPRLLLLDDEPHVVEGLAAHLGRTYRIETCTRPAEAVARFATAPFDGIVSDLRMPGMDGVEVLREVRRLAPAAARILLTGQADVGAAMKAVNDAAVHRFLAKPCGPDALVQAIDESLVLARESVSGGAMAEQVVSLGARATLGTMAGSIGHEIDSLVAAMQGSLDLVRDLVDRGEQPGIEDICVLDMVRMRLGEHANQLKGLSRPRPMRFDELAVGQVLYDVLAILRRGGVLRRCRLDVSVPDVPLYVMGDRPSLEVVFINVLKNAAEAVAARLAVHDPRRAGPDEDLDPLVLVDLREVAGGRARVSISDNGIGMDAEVAARVFEPFFSARAGGGGGMGLGLSIVRATVEQHGGRIQVRSMPMAGTTVDVEIPLAALSREHE